MPPAHGLAVHPPVLAHEGRGGIYEQRHPAPSAGRRALQVTQPAGQGSANMEARPAGECGGANGVRGRIY
jgi:hypothetical protein